MTSEQWLDWAKFFFASLAAMGGGGFALYKFTATARQANDGGRVDDLKDRIRSQDERIEKQDDEIRDLRREIDLMRRQLDFYRGFVPTAPVQPLM